MCHTGGKRPKRGQLFLSLDNGAAFDELRAERRNFHAVHQARGCEPQNEHRGHQGHQKSLQASQRLMRILHKLV